MTSYVVKKGRKFYAGRNWRGFRWVDRPSAAQLFGSAREADAVASNSRGTQITEQPLAHIIKLSNGYFKRRVGDRIDATLNVHKATKYNGRNEAKAVLDSLPVRGFVELY